MKKYIGDNFMKDLNSWDVGNHTNLASFFLVWLWKIQYNWENSCSFYKKGAVRIAIYSDTRIANGPILFISGQTPQQEAETPADIYTQTKIVLHKIQIILQQHEIDWSAIAKMTVFITDAADLSGLRKAFTDILGETKPAMSLVVVAGLIDPSFKVEIDAQAELPFKR